MAVQVPPTDHQVSNPAPRSTGAATASAAETPTATKDQAPVICPRDKATEPRILCTALRAPETGSAAGTALGEETATAETAPTEEGRVRATELLVPETDSVEGTAATEETAPTEEGRVRPTELLAQETVSVEEVVETESPVRRTERPDSVGTEETVSEGATVGPVKATERL